MLGVGLCLLLEPSTAMGDFFGHSLPAAFFIMVGIWWLVNTYKGYFRSQCQDRALPHVNALTFPIRSLGRGAHLDAIILVVLCSIGIVVELVLCPVFRTHGKLPMEQVHHATMYFFFGLFAMTVLMTARATTRLGYKCEDLQYVTLAMALSVEGFLFMFHLYGREEEDSKLHTMLFFAICGGAVCTWLEMVYRNNVLLALGRVFFTLLQGTWFWQISFWLFNPFEHHDGDDHDFSDRLVMPFEPRPHSETSHDRIMLMACAFTWHAGAIMIFMMMLGAGMAWRCKKQHATGPVAVETPVLPKAWPTANSESHALLKQDMELSDSDL